MTTAARPTQFDTAAAEATTALLRLAELARTDYTVGSVVNALTALTADGGPLDALLDMLSGLDSYLREFEHEDASAAAAWLEDATDETAAAASHVSAAKDCLRDLAE